MSAIIALIKDQLNVKLKLNSSCWNQSSIAIAIAIYSLRRKSSLMQIFERYFQRLSDLSNLHWICIISKKKYLDCFVPERNYRRRAAMLNEEVGKTH